MSHQSLRISDPRNPPSNTSLPNGFFRPQSTLMPSRYPLPPVATPQSQETNFSQSAHKRQRISDCTRTYCVPCKLNLESESALQAHIQSHISCTVCGFQAAPKVVKGHYQSVHGEFSVSGFKTVTVAVPGCPVQRFRICVGNRPEDIQEWIAERRKRFPRSTPAPQKGTKPEEGLTSLLGGYGSSSSEEESSSALNHGTETAASKDTHSSRQPPSFPNTQQSVKKPCRYFSRNGKCRNGDACPFSHNVIPNQLMRARKGSPKSLLKKLLANDMRRETTLALQLFRYMVDTDFLEKSSCK